MAYNDYKDKLNFSKNAVVREGVERKIHEYFVGIKEIEFAGDKKRQCEGKDIIVKFKNGGQQFIDLKIRSHEALKYNDIAIELFHIPHGKTYEDRRDGWIKYSQCDYILYVVINKNYEIEKSYLLEFRILQKVIAKNYKAWYPKYRIIAPNKTYDTHNITIKTQMLLDEISKIMNFKLN
jgi:hypothetical protein